MATSGPALYPGATTFPGSTTYPGSGEASVMSLLYSTDPASEPVPTWQHASSYLRAYSTSRGRESELQDVAPGTMTLVLNDRDRTFDPDFNSLIRPMNRWWLREQFSGETHSVFKGYAESYQESWVKGSEDATTTVSCVDEFKVLALDKLPSTDPPRGSYQELVMFDQPAGYWPMDNDSTTMSQAAVVGEALTSAGGGMSSQTGQGAIVGQEPSVNGVTQSDDYWWKTPPHEVGQSGDAGGLAEFTAEGWFRAVTSFPGSTEILFMGPWSGVATYTWKISLNTAGNFLIEAKNSGGTTHTCTSTSTPVLDTWYHVVATITTATLRLYVNGVEEASTAWTGVFGAIDPAGQPLVVGNNGVAVSGTGQRGFDELAFYRAGLTPERVLAHYEAGTERGFEAGSHPGFRVLQIIQASENAGVGFLISAVADRTMTGSYMTGQSFLEELRKAERAEGDDAVLFIGNEGRVWFLDNDHRGRSPWNTVQATFDDDDTDLPYQDISLDYSESFLFNEWNVTATGGTTQTVSDATSIGLYGKRSQTITDLPVTDADAADIAARMLAKYKDPMRRVIRLEIVAHTEDVIDNIFQRDIGDRIRVFRTPPGGGARIDQTLFIQKIAVVGTPGQPRRITLGVSPL